MHRCKRLARLWLAAGALALLAGCTAGDAARKAPPAPSNAQQLAGPAAGKNPAYLLTIRGKNSKIIEHKCTEKECAGSLFCREPAAGESR